MPEVASRARVVQVWVEPGAKASRSGPSAPTIGAVLSKMTSTVVVWELPALSYAVAVTGTGPSGNMAPSGRTEP